MEAYALHWLRSEEAFVLWVVVHEQSRVKRDVVVADFVIVSGGNDHGFPPDAINDEPSRQTLVSAFDSLEGEPFKQLIELRVLFVPRPPFFFEVFSH